MLSVIIMYECQSLSHKCVPNGIAYPLIADLIPFSLYLVQIPDFVNGKSSPYHNRAASVFYSRWNTSGCSSFINSSTHIDASIWPKDFELWFVNPKDIVPPLYCPVFERLALLGTFNIVLFPQPWLLGINSVI